jgi:nucleoside-diphosphate-sugar epimerase
MYGAAGGDDEVTEEAPLMPLTHYATSKVRSEEDLAALADGDFSPVFLRNATAYGASPAIRADLVVNNLAGFAVHSGQVRILSDGTPWRPLVHILDMSLAAACALEAPREAIHGEAFNIAPRGENYQIRDVARIVAEAVPGAELSIATDASPDARSYRVSFDKAHEQLPGFAPRWRVPDGVAQVRDHWTALGLEGEGWLARPYTRLAQLKHLGDTGQVDAELRLVGAPA